MGKTKLVGFCEMKKTEGKVLFVVYENIGEPVVGSSCDKIFCYGQLSDKIASAHIGKYIEPVWGQGFNGKAVLNDINIL